MSARNEFDPARGWRGAMRVAREEAERLAKVSDEEFEEAMKALPEAAAEPEVAAVRAARERVRSRWVVWAAAACVVAAVVLLALVGRREVVAWWHRGEIAPDRERAPRRQEAPVEDSRAVALRTAAFAACERKEWLECLDKLEDAKAIDPAGDRDPRVEKARGDATEGLRKMDVPDEKAPKGVP